jgi:hypothetical protein
VKNLNLWGLEITDLSVLEHMPNVEVLSLSVNKLHTLAHFRHCARLQELYLRKNEVRHLSELRHLRGLPSLAVLWLDDNPCAELPDYRLHVARNLPSVTKLDNLAITPEEREACRRLPELPELEPYAEGGGAGDGGDAGDAQTAPAAASAAPAPAAPAAPAAPSAQQLGPRCTSKNVLCAIMALINDVEQEEDLAAVKAAVEQRLAALGR